MPTIPQLPRLSTAVLGLAILFAPKQAICYELPPPVVDVSGTTGSVSWQGSGTLYASDTLADDWSVTGTTESPHVETITSITKRFFRVVYQTSNSIPVDTNQTVYYDDAGSEIDPAPASGEAYFGQDAEYVQNAASYTDNSDGTVTDNNTGLIWQQTPPDAFYSRTEAQTYADALVLAGESDWRLPTIKELLSLADFNGSSRPEIDLPYIDTTYFTVYDPLATTTFVPAGTSSTKRDIDGQYWSSNDYVGRTINDDSATFGFNFVDGRIKGYPNGLLSGPTGTAYVRCVRGSTTYGQNNFIDNGDSTITDLATGLMWLQDDSGSYPSAGSQGDGTLDWPEALAWAEGLEHAGYNDWRLPDAKQLHTIVDYTRAPDAAIAANQTAAIDPVFQITETESWFWTSTSLGDDLFKSGIYIAFGRALAIDQTTFLPTTNAHGAGAMRSDPKTGDPESYPPGGNGPQFDQIRIFNYARPVRQAFTPTLPRDPAGLTVTISGDSAAPADLDELPTSLTFNGITVDLESVSRPARQELSFDHVIYGVAPGDYTVVATFASGVLTGTYTIHANTLLMIVDDWGQDANPLYNNTSGALLANMPHLATLASQGLSFTRAYTQPTCSPTRATIMTGRQPYQHGVGTPEDAGNFSTSEITLPEILTTMNAPHAMLSVGKWHLGGNDTGYSTRGGWPGFYGITGGGVASYTSWDKNSNGTSATSTTYTTTDQVNEAKTFIDARAVSGTPWFTWVAFNAPHDPFHDPPAELAPTGGYTTIGTSESTSSHQYRNMLEALDTEIGRLLESIDPAQTNIIIIGDNGTPGAVVQAPYGDGHAKGSLYNGGTHVPMIVKGPAVTVAAGSSTDKLVHCADLFSTILELSGVNESAVPDLAAQDVASTSIVPILTGTDSADRCVIVESNGGSIGRAIILDDSPDYKLVIQGDPDDPLDSPVLEFYATSVDANEQSPLDIGSLTGQALAAYNACVAKDAALGGGYSDEPTGNFDTLYIELATTGVSPGVPNLTQGNGNAINVTAVTVDGNPATLIGRIGSGISLGDETDDPAERYWVKVRIAPANGGPYTTAHVVFPDQPAGQGGAAREYDSISIQVNPHP